MHLAPRDLHRLEEGEAAIDLEQTPAEVVFLSLSDSELRLLAALREERGEGGASLRCASIAQLKHPFSVDLYLEKVVGHARLVVARLLGGKDYWPYGVDELARLARMKNIALALVPGDSVDDPRLRRASTLDAGSCDRIWAYFDRGGPENLTRFLDYADTIVAGGTCGREPVAVPAAGRYEAARRDGGEARALIVFYRSAYLSGDAAPILALADALASEGLSVEAIYVTSLKESESEAFVRATLKTVAPDVILNTTAFSARGSEGGVLDLADAPVLQAALAISTKEAWERSPRGASGADLAMNIVLPEVDGRIFTRAISFKEMAQAFGRSEFDAPRHAPEASRVSFVAALAANWARLRRKPNVEKSIALILSDYPARRGRGGYAIGLDAEASAYAIVEALAGEGYDVGGAEPLREGQGLVRRLEESQSFVELTLDDYRARFAALPENFRRRVEARWGAPQDDSACAHEAFRFSCIESGKLVVAFQPDRGARAERRESYHDGESAPRHAYVAFYLWLRSVRRIDAMIHLGAHGTLEFLPGKSVMLAPDCAPEALLGPTPMVYPFIVNNPGEAAQAKRRLAAVTIGHMTPPLEEAQLYDDAARLEQMLDEYAQAAALDPRRARRIAGAVLDEAQRSGLAQECGLKRDADELEALARLDAWLCDVKELRIGVGLHVFGRAENEDPMRAACARAERAALLGALAGRFIEPGPAGAPSRGRRDVLPTGRNLFCIDPRHAPTRSAYDIGRRAAEEVMTRHAREHGDWPRALVLDLWGSATIRTGGEDFAQALALLGVEPLWDDATGRVSGFEIISAARREFPRVDVTLHVSGVFRDMFPALVALFHDAVHAVAALDEDEAFNPLTGVRGSALERVFGAAQGVYGLGLSETLQRGAWEKREELGAAFLDAAGFAYDRAGESRPARESFAARVAGADALVHVQDMAETDVLAGSAFAEFEGGFCAANRALGGAASLTHLDLTDPTRPRPRSLKSEVARVTRGRLANPRWLSGQMRHGHRGAAEIAEAIDNLYAFAAFGDLVSDEQFDLAHRATLGDEEVSAFLARENPRALEAIARVFAEALARGLWRSRRNSAHFFNEAADDTYR
ncbi:cobaltochelatase subunit CobN [Methylocystis bryophila]|uniref:Cobaltochelatase subunit CobN n=1 Tax=Methylocystis bryophila TaxID=655015 RepID=A0A1W6MZ76_9HYPH|nr:cobaltochelatase subunit CobN [Methylocystis bryophila]ARN82897.1 cobaltochelatase subunit CobN [Methylocystis bryophila]BDV39174.1 cobaltochelatase subunit CobN [Methylocystis bryophila]